MQIPMPSVLPIVTAILIALVVMLLRWVGMGPDELRGNGDVVHTFVPAGYVTLLVTSRSLDVVRNRLWILSLNR